jgi:hypothetical protein
MILIRDSKEPQGGNLNFTTGEWNAFIGGVHNGEFDCRRPRDVRQPSNITPAHMSQLARGTLKLRIFLPLVLEDCNQPPRPVLPDPQSRRHFSRRRHLIPGLGKQFPELP